MGMAEAIDGVNAHLEALEQDSLGRMNLPRSATPGDPLLLENTRLRAQLAAAHDHLHHGRIDEAHGALHCDECTDAEKALSGQNVSVNDADNLTRFAQRFNGLCAEHAQSIQEVRRMMGKAPTRAAGSPPGRAPGADGKTGRNDPCPCGSGRKFKQCCIRRR